MEVKNPKTYPITYEDCFNNLIWKKHIRIKFNDAFETKLKHLKPGYSVEQVLKITRDSINLIVK